jgi:hypothetical protein
MIKVLLTTIISTILYLVLSLAMSYAGVVPLTIWMLY